MKNSDELHPPTAIEPVVLNELSTVNETIVQKNKEVDLYNDLLKIKQERKERDLRLRPLFLNVGMAVSILLAIIAINWKSYDSGDIVDLGEIQGDLNEIIEIPISSQPPPPPPPKQEVFKIAEVKDTEIIEDIKINLDVEVTENEVVEVVDYTPPEEEEVVDEIFVVVEQEPTPKGGIGEFYAYLAGELRYPPTALRLGISGAVYVQFVIEKDGSITNVQLAKGIGAGCDEEAIRVIQNAPAWNPGKQRGVPVRVKKIIPVRFILEKR